MTDSNIIYQKRINLVIDQISKNLDKSYSLDELAKIAHFSPYYFHRIFTAVLGESVNSYTNRVRIEKAAKLLSFSSKDLSSIAFECGFSSPSTFSRSFKNYFDLSPSAFRKSGDNKNRKICKELHPMENYLCDMTLEEKMAKFPIEIKQLPKRKLAYLRVIDSFKEGAVIKAFEELIIWAKKKELYATGQFFGMSIDDPFVTPENKYRYEACMLVPNDMIAGGDEKVQIMHLPKCKYATTKVSGNINLVATAIGYMYNNWLINNPFEPEHQYGLEYFLDNKSICNWDQFNLELYIPIIPLIKY